MPAMAMCGTSVACSPSATKPMSSACNKAISIASMGLGGAGRGTERLHQSLVVRSVECVVLPFDHAPDDEDVLEPAEIDIRAHLDLFEETIERVLDSRHDADRNAARVDAT